MSSEKNFKTSDQAWTPQLFDDAVCDEHTLDMQNIIADQYGVSATWWARDPEPDLGGRTLPAPRIWEVFSGASQAEACLKP